MSRLRSIICIMLALLVMFNICINHAIATSKKDQKAMITAHEPKTRMSEVKKSSANKSGKTWLWVLLGVVVIGGGIAALASGASSDDGGSSGGTNQSDTSTTGDYDFSW